MKNFFFYLACILILFSGLTSVAQEDAETRKTVKDGKTYAIHQVKAGETLYSIGKKYGVEVLSILNSNPQLISGLKSGDELSIPLDENGRAASFNKQSQTPDRVFLHEVQRKETLYSISRKYGITIDDILSQNPGLGTLKKGNQIKIPEWDKTPVAVTDLATRKAELPEVIMHQVVAGETLFGIARKYNTTAEQIRNDNPGSEILKPGMMLRVHGKRETTSVIVEEPVNEEFKQHTIVSGETLFSLTRKYKVSAERLVELNPELNSSFKTGTVIRIPVVQESVSQDKFLYHIVRQGETLFRISQFYRVTTHELEEWNSFLTYRSILPGDSVRVIPGSLEELDKTAQDQIFRKAAGECDAEGNGAWDGQTIDVVMFLPLFSDTNNAINQEQHDLNSPVTGDGSAPVDSLDVVRSGRDSQIRFQGNSENFIHFYEGALLAVDSLEQKGINVNLKVYDTESKQTRIKQLIATDRLLDADLIIGPVYPNDQKEVAEYAMRNQIPMVSPLSATDEITLSNPWVFQVNPSREIINEITAAYVSETYSNGNFIVLKTGSQVSAPENEMIRMIREKVTLNGNGTGRFHNCDFQKSGLAGLRGMMMPDRKNIVLMTSANEADVSVGLSNIHVLAPNFDITVIGTNRYVQFESINQEYLHEGQLEFFAPFWPDYKNDIAKSFVRKFRHYFKTEPNQFSMQGFDVTLYFAEAIRLFGHDFRPCLHTLSPTLVQGNYRFHKFNSGGYINKGLNVVTFTKDYTVVTNRRD